MPTTITSNDIKLNQLSYVDIPVGTILIWLSNTLPNTDTYLWCDGSTYSPSTYVELYNILGNRYGGTTVSPKLPNLTSRFPIGGVITGNNMATTLSSNEPSTVVNATEQTGGNSSLLPSQFIHTHTVTSDPSIYSIAGHTNNTDYDNDNRDDFDNASWHGTQTFGETGTSTHLPPYYSVDYIIYTGKKLNVNNKY